MIDTKRLATDPSDNAWSEDRRRAEGDKWDSKALALQAAIIQNPRVDDLEGIFEGQIDDDHEGAEAYAEVEAMLSDFNLPPRTLSVLQKSRGYMSGSGVLAARARSLEMPPFKPGDVDFYIQEKESHGFKEFLLESGERKLWKEVNFTQSTNQAVAEEHEYAAGDALPLSSTVQSGLATKSGKLRIAKLWYFRDGEDNQVNVIVTASRCALVPIVAFHSTPVMNFIAYFGVVSLYGSLTEMGMRWVNRDLTSKPLSQQDIEGWMRKYADRGYTIYEGSNIPGPYKGHRCRLDEECTLTIRHLFDDGVRITKFPQYRGEANLTLLKTLEPVFAWQLRNRACKGETNEDGDRRGFVKTVDEYYRL
ncbi:hypothetical protein BKA70DRAFT_1442604 [Coprinopsis sp. MPI-PUGE-AT-0042]|nr:hypothetical protein BKA70DRAFT_1442604 [Coprinopsis sp. MPI-PUGE-AT-0042]